MYNHKEKVKMSKETVSEVSQYPIKAIEERGINLETATQLGIRTAVSSQDGETASAYYFPHEDSGKITGYWARSASRKSFWVVGNLDINCSLFNMGGCNGGKKLYITEGMFDTAALWQVFRNHTKGTKWETTQLPVVSIGFGTSNAVQHLSNNRARIEQFAEIVLVFDQDSATESEKKKGIVKGQDAVAQVCHLFPHARVARFSRKDANDMLLAGLDRELYWSCVKAETYRPQGIISGAEISLEKLREPRPKGISLPFPELDKKMRGLRLGELTVLIAPAKSGKSTVVSEIEYHLNNYHQEKVAAIHLESGHEEAARNQIAMDNKVLPDHLAEDPTLISEEDYRASFDKLINNGRYFSISHWGSLESESLLEKIRHFATVEGIRFIVLDHISMVFSGMMSNDERKDIDWLLTQLAQMVVELQIHIIAVAHIKRGQKDFYNGAVPTLSDARGSGAFEQLAFNVVSVARDHMADNNDQITLHLLANRKARKTGECDTLMYDQNTGRLKAITEEF